MGFGVFVVYVFMFLYGVGNGILIIVKGILLFVLFGLVGYGCWIGWFNVFVCIL